MTEKDFMQLLDRFEKGLCTSQERAQIERWLDTMRENETSFPSDAEKEFAKAHLHRAIYEKAGISREESYSSGLFKWMKVAAAVLVLALGCYTFMELDLFEPERQNIVTEATDKNDVEKVMLSDGSLIWLKGDSKLSYPETFSGKERVVSLVGEALFEVAKDSKRPFIIHTGDLTTQVLGTSFNIKTTSEHTEVYVLTGRVSVSLAKTDRKIELLPKERIMYSHMSNELEKEGQVVESTVVDEYIKGTDYYMYFQDTKVIDIARHIESKFNIKVELQGKIRRCVLTADFTDQSLNSTLDMISEALAASYQIEGNTVILSGEGCE